MVTFDIVCHKVIGAYAVEHLDLLFVRNVLWLNQMLYRFI